MDAKYIFIGFVIFGIIIMCGVLYFFNEIMNISTKEYNGFFPSSYI